MDFNTLEIRQHYEYSEYGDSNVVRFKVVSADDDFMDIGDEYIIPRSGRFHDSKEREEVGVQVTFHDFATVDQIDNKIYREKLKQTEDKIVGIGRFYDGISKHSNSYPPVLSIQIWLPSDGYANLMDQLRGKIYPSSIDINFVTKLKDEVGVSFGWEPDGCHLIWKMNPDEKHPFIDIESVTISYDLVKRTLLDIQAEEVINEYQQERNKEIVSRAEEAKPQELTVIRVMLDKTYTLLMLIFGILVLLLIKFW